MHGENAQHHQQRMATAIDRAYATAAFKQKQRMGALTVVEVPVACPCCRRVPCRFAGRPMFRGSNGEWR
jgi:hypothetical protein